MNGIIAAPEQGITNRIGKLQIDGSGIRNLQLNYQ
jgi:hypothetical protein